MLYWMARPVLAIRYERHKEDFQSIYTFNRDQMPLPSSEY